MATTRSNTESDQHTTLSDAESDNESIGNEQTSEPFPADSVETIDDEASREFENFLGLNSLEGNNESHLFVNIPKDSSTSSLHRTKVPIYSMPKVYEINNLSYICIPFSLTEADKLNNIKWRGRGEIHGKAYRWKHVGGAWTEWIDADGSELKTISIKKSETKWTFEDTDKNVQMHKPREIDLKSDAEFMEKFKNILVENEWSTGTDYFGKLVLNDSGNFKIDLFDMTRKRKIIANGIWQIKDSKKIVFKYQEKGNLHQDEYEIKAAGINYCKLALITSQNSILPEDLELQKDLRNTEYYTSLHNFDILEPIVESKSNAYRLLVLPKNLRIKIPKNWEPVSDDWNETIEAYGQATIDLSGVEVPDTGDKLLFRSTSRPRSTYASISVYAGPKEFDPEELRNPSEEDRIEATHALKEMTEKLIAVNGYKLKDFKPISIIDVDGHVGIETQYIRNGNKGDVSVWTERLIVGDSEITVQIAHRIAEEQIWKPIIEYMKASIRIQK